MKTIRIDRHEQIATLWFTRPDAMNSFDQQMGEELPAAVEEIANDPSIRLCVVRGEGKAFMAGGDVKFMAENLTVLPQAVVKLARQLHFAIIGLRTMPKPVLAAIHGPCAGAGMSLMLAADLAIASQEAQFAMAYSQLGVACDGGASIWLTRMLGQRRATEMLMLSPRFDGTRALELGLVNATAPASDFEKLLQEWCTRLVNGPTAAYASIKELVNGSYDHSLETHLECEAQNFAKSAKTEDFAAGVMGFVNKRNPQFTGK
jgi:2-(1,2-epoxy-1,2-dihydrophenyl)acetyl-CoA isomerase